MKNLVVHPNLNLAYTKEPKSSVLETNADWTNIKLENGNEGWLKTSEVGLF